jgi:hypothetical protein
MNRLFPLLLIVAAALAGCADPNVRYSRTGDALLDTVPTLAELAKRSELIVVGRVVRSGEIWNIARGENPATESKYNIVLAQNYTVAVETALKGSTQSTEIIFAVPKAWGVVGHPIADDPEWLPPTVGARYALFLRQIPGTLVYGQVAEPYRFRLDSDAHVESRWSEAAKYYPTNKSDVFIELIRTAARTPMP